MQSPSGEATAAPQQPPKPATAVAEAPKVPFHETLHFFNNAKPAPAMTFADKLAKKHKPKKIGIVERFGLKVSIVVAPIQFSATDPHHAHADKCCWCHKSRLHYRLRHGWNTAAWPNCVEFSVANIVKVPGAPTAVELRVGYVADHGTSCPNLKMEDERKRCARARRARRRARVVAEHLMVQKGEHRLYHVLDYLGQIEKPPTAAGETMQAASPPEKPWDISDLPKSDSESESSSEDEKKKTETAAPPPLPKRDTACGTPFADEDYGLDEPEDNSSSAVGDIKPGELDPEPTDEVIKKDDDTISKILGAFVPPPYVPPSAIAPPQLHCSFCNRPIESQQAAIVCECQGAIYDTNECKSKHYFSGHKEAHDATLKLAEEDKRVTQLASTAGNSDGAMTTAYASSMAVIPFKPAEALGMRAMPSETIDQDEFTGLVRDAEYLAQKEEQELKCTACDVGCPNGNGVIADNGVVAENGVVNNGVVNNGMVMPPLYNIPAENGEIMPPLIEIDDNENNVVNNGAIENCCTSAELVPIGDSYDDDTDGDDYSDTPNVGAPDLVDISTLREPPNHKIKTVQVPALLDYTTGNVVYPAETVTITKDADRRDTAVGAPGGHGHGGSGGHGTFPGGSGFGGRMGLGSGGHGGYGYRGGFYPRGWGVYPWASYPLGGMYSSAYCYRYPWNCPPMIPPAYAGAYGYPYVGEEKDVDATVGADVNEGDEHVGHLGLGLGLLAGGLAGVGLTAAATAPYRYGYYPSPYYYGRYPYYVGAEACQALDKKCGEETDKSATAVGDLHDHFGIHHGRHHPHHPEMFTPLYGEIVAPAMVPPMPYGPPHHDRHHGHHGRHHVGEDSDDSLVGSPTGRGKGSSSPARHSVPSRAPPSRPKQSAPPSFQKKIVPSGASRGRGMTSSIGTRNPPALPARGPTPARITMPRNPRPLPLTPPEQAKMLAQSRGTMIARPVPGTTLVAGRGAPPMAIPGRGAPPKAVIVTKPWNPRPPIQTGAVAVRPPRPIAVPVRPPPFSAPHRIPVPKYSRSVPIPRGYYNRYGPSVIRSVYGYYPWYRQMPHGCYYNPALCSLAYSIPFMMSGALYSYAPHYPMYSEIPVETPLSFSNVMLPFGYPEIFSRLPPPPPYEMTDKWSRWWSALIMLAAQNGMLAPAVPGDWSYVRWLKPAYGVHNFYWIPPSFRPYVEQGWAGQVSPADYAPPACC